MEVFDLRRIQDAFAEPLEDFVRRSGANLAVLINRSGQVLAQHGFDQMVDLVGVASLAAGINASSRALANQLGEERFEHLHHAGRSRQLFLGRFETPAGQFILVTVFDGSSSIGLIRVFFDDLVRQVNELPSMRTESRAVSAEDFERELEAGLNRFFDDLVDA